ncbi:C-type lectin domain family 4 member M-like [Clavelina lepadiformis]|uniref:C-type lectin domain family 4 member M-like n=1 Tax=Clavelina lepadiformis TaxID=159417 RepID=UPI0040432723
MFYALLSISLLVVHNSDAQNCCPEVEQIRRELQASVDPSWFVPFNGFQYKLTSEKHSWTDARSECQRMGADLASTGIRSFETRQIIWRRLTVGYAWAGLSDIESEGNYVWVDGVQGSYYWRSGEPNNAGGNEDCVNFAENGYLNDNECSFQHKGLCEKRI